ncbi:MAG: acetylxylan esterase, partial [Lentisphaeria bacterium]|nr:acetylxylan esterase [Lentisphaeria bacterium]
MKKFWCAAVCSLLALAVAGGYTGEIALDKADGIYRSGETAKCRVLLKKDGKALSGVKARLVLKWEGQVIERRPFVTTGEAQEFTYTSDKPGWIYFGFEILGENGKPLRGKIVQVHPRKPTIAAEIGAIYDPTKLLSPVREPADFDEFWAKRRAEVEAVTQPPTLTELECKTPGIRLFAVTIPCPRGVTATGYLAYPKTAAPKSLLGYVFFQSLTQADVNPRNAVVQAKRGVLSLAVTWHGFPGGKSQQFYEKTLRAYLQGGARGIGDREKWVYMSSD